MRVHLNLDGSWDECVEDACELLYHLPDVTVAEAKLLPEPVLLGLFEIVQPPSAVLFFGSKEWYDEGSQPHRDYDLPAVIGENGTLEWYQHGVRHRGGDKPAWVSAFGDFAWWEHDSPVRANGGPSMIQGDGSQHWFELKPGAKNAIRLHRGEALPALIHPDGREEFWVHGKLTGVGVLPA